MAIRVANNQSLTAITALPSAVSGGAMTLLETQTASSSATLSFTSGIDSTYDEYVFKFYDIHPETNNVQFNVNFRDGSTAYDATKTTTYVRVNHAQNDGEAALGYVTGNDVAQGTGVQKLSEPTGDDNDESVSGYLHLFDPSSTTFVKHFHSVACDADMSDQIVNSFVAGYCNVTAAIDGVQFNFSTGNIQSGVIKMYGVT